MPLLCMLSNHTAVKVRNLPPQFDLFDVSAPWYTAVFSVITQRSSPPHSGEEHCVTTLKTAVQQTTSKFEEVCFPHHWLKSSISQQDNDLSLRHRANLILDEATQCNLHLLFQRKSVKLKHLLTNNDLINRADKTKHTMGIIETVTLVCTSLLYKFV